MSQSTEITLSIVTFKTSSTNINNILRSISEILSPWRLYIVDNSPTQELRKELYDHRIQYIHNPLNPGFGAGHNIAMNLAIESGSKYHFIINPDIYFHDDVFTPMVNYMEKHKNVGMMMPEVLYPDGSIQYLPKLLPNPLWIFRRKFKRPKNSFNRFIGKYELRNLPRKRIYNSPILSGCFTLLNLNVIEEVGGYDDKFFMYFEDFDLSRRVHQKYQTIYFPEVSVYHHYEGGANKNLKLFNIFLSSAITYFNKWGWFNDEERYRINSQALKID